MTQEFKTIGQCIDWLNVDKNQNDVFIITLLDNRRVELMWGQKPPHNIYHIIAKDNDGDYFDIGYVTSKCKTIRFIDNRPYDMDFLEALDFMDAGGVVESEQEPHYYIKLDSDLYTFFLKSTNAECQPANAFFLKNYKFRPYTPSKASEEV